MRDSEMLNFLHYQCWSIRTSSSFNYRRKHRRKNRNPPIACEIAILEDRTLLSISSIVALSNISVSDYTNDKAPSAVWKHDGTWWTALSNSSGTDVYRLDGSQWTSVHTLSTAKGVTDVKVDGDVVHVLIERAKASKLASVEYNAAEQSYGAWSVRPNEVSVPLHSSTEAATIDIDSTGRMWVVNDENGKIQVRFADAPYDNWSEPITLAANVKSDDIAAIAALPDNSIAVIFSDQNSKRFRFRIHPDSNAPDEQFWLPEEIAAEQSALDNVGAGMADDHVNMAVTKDGTIFAAIKTGYAFFIILSHCFLLR